MKMHCYFLLNIKHGASVLLGAPAKYNYEAPEGVWWRGLFRADLSEAPWEGPPRGGGLQLSSAGTVYNNQLQ